MDWIVSVTDLHQTNVWRLFCWKSSYVFLYIIFSSSTTRKQTFSTSLDQTRSTSPMYSTVQVYKHFFDLTLVTVYFPYCTGHARVMYRSSQGSLFFLVWSNKIHILPYLWRDVFGRDVFTRKSWIWFYFYKMHKTHLWWRLCTCFAQSQLEHMQAKHDGLSININRLMKSRSNISQKNLFFKNLICLVVNLLLCH